METFEMRLFCQIIINSGQFWQGNVAVKTFPIICIEVKPAKLLTWHAIRMGSVFHKNKSEQSLCPDIFCTRLDLWICNSLSWGTPLWGIRKSAALRGRREQPLPSSTIHREMTKRTICNTETNVRRHHKTLNLSANFPLFQRPSALFWLKISLKQKTSCAVAARLLKGEKQTSDNCCQIREKS